MNRAITENHHIPEIEQHQGNFYICSILFVQAKKKPRNKNIICYATEVVLWDENTLSILH